MTIRAWLTEIPRRLVSRSRLRTDYLLSPEKFAQAALCERTRVDRNGSKLAILRSLGGARAWTREQWRAINDILQLRLRITDTAGRTSDGRLSILLPDTGIEGAEVVALDLQNRFRKHLGDVYFEIGSYPDDFGDGAGEAPSPEPDGLVRQPAELLFAQRCPAWKRGIDVVGAAVGLVVAGPVIGAAALAIRLTSSGPAFFLQEREGLGGRRFRICKLRTMRTDAEALKAALRAHSEQDGPAFKMTHDPRVTGIGRLLRKTSIDELPQLWNVLKGDMSLVGPRPLPVDESLNCAQWQRQRLVVRPGLTCIWQVRGRNVVAFDEWIRMDLRYVRRRALWYDLFLLASTGPAVVAAKGPR